MRWPTVRASATTAAPVDDQPSATHRVEVRGLPAWLDADPLLGVAGARYQPAADGRAVAQAALSLHDAADLSARLRGVAIDGRLLEVLVEPKLPRAAVRAARTTDARRRRDTSVGFSRPGVRMDDEGHRSLTPEELALQLGRRAGALHVVDAGCGVGGNAIGFARAGCRVTAIEHDAERLAMARHNARVYGVGDAITFVHGDALQHAAAAAADLCFVDPPWGQWDRTRVELADLPLLQALAREPVAPRLWAKLPPSFAVESFPNAEAAAIFGVAEGDRRRIKFLLLEVARD